MQWNEIRLEQTRRAFCDARRASHRAKPLCAIDRHKMWKTSRRFQTRKRDSQFYENPWHSHARTISLLFFIRQKYHVQELNCGL